MDRKRWLPWLYPAYDARNILSIKMCNCIFITILLTSYPHVDIMLS